MSFSHDIGAQNVPVRYRHESWPIPDTWRAADFNWIKHQGHRHDYFLVLSKSDRAPLLFRGSARKKVALQAQHGNWYLYKAVKKD